MLKLLWKCFRSKLGVEMWRAAVARWRSGGMRDSRALVGKVSDTYRTGIDESL